MTNSSQDDATANGAVLRETPPSADGQALPEDDDNFVAPAVARALTIAGSDSGGGAGIQADLKTFAAFGVYGMSAIAAVTAQNTVEVTDWLAVPAAMVEKQIDAVLSDIGADAVKTGMLANAEIIETVAATLRRHGVTQLVVDPVMVAKGGHKLLEDAAIAVLIRDLIPMALVVTPNLPEAEVLTKRTIATWEDARQAAAQIADMGAKTVVIKGGHFENDPAATDLFFDGQRYHEFNSVRVQTNNTHGTGCTFASGIAASLAKGVDVRGSVALAKAFVTLAMQHSYDIGHGHGPVHHFYRYWQPSGRRYRPGVVVRTKN